VRVEVKFITIAEGFFERIGVDFNINLPNTAKNNVQAQVTSQQFQAPGQVNAFEPTNTIIGFDASGARSRPTWTSPSKPRASAWPSRRLEVFRAFGAQRRHLDGSGCLKRCPGLPLHGSRPGRPAHQRHAGAQVDVVQRPNFHATGNRSAVLRDERQHPGPPMAS